MTVKDRNLLSSTPNIQLQTRHLHTSLIMGKNSPAGWNKLTSLPYNHKRDIKLLKYASLRERKRCHTRNLLTI